MVSNVPAADPASVGSVHGMPVRISCQRCILNVAVAVEHLTALPSMWAPKCAISSCPSTAYCGPSALAPPLWPSPPATSGSVGGRKCTANVCTSCAPCAATRPVLRCAVPFPPPRCSAWHRVACPPTLSNATATGRSCWRLISMASGTPGPCLRALKRALVGSTADLGHLSPQSLKYYERLRRPVSAQRLELGKDS